MNNYILNIKTGKIHNALNPCAQCKSCKEGNKKYFVTYEDAVNYFEGKTAKGIPCGKCLKEKDR